MKYTDEEIKFIEDKFPELKPKQLPTLDYSKLLVKPNLDQIIVSFLEKECEVFVQPSSVGEWNGWDTLSAIGIIFSGAGSLGNIASTIFYSNRSKQVSESAEDWRSWKMWALDQKQFVKFKSEVINGVESYNLRIREETNKEISKIENENKNIKQKLRQTSIIKKIDEALQIFHAEKNRFRYFEMPECFDIYNWTEYAIYRSLLQKPIPSPQMWDELCELFIVKGIDFHNTTIEETDLKVFFDKELFEDPKYLEISFSTSSAHGGFLVPGNSNANKMQNSRDTLDKEKTVKLFLNIKKFIKSPIIKIRIKSQKDLNKIHDAVIDIYNLISPLERIDIWELEPSNSWIDFNNLLLEDIKKNNFHLLERVFTHAEKIFDFEKTKILEINKNLRNDYWFIDMFQLLFDEKVLDVIYKTRKIPEFLNPKNLK